MTLRKKSLIAIVLAFLSLLAILAAAAAILMDSFAALELRQTNTDAQRARDSLSNSLMEMESKSGDWGNWDDAYAFVDDGNPDFIQSNLTDDTFVQLNLDVIAFVDLSGRVVYAKSLNDDTRVVQTFPTGLLEHFKPGDLLVQPGAATSVQTGVLLLPEGALLIVSRPIMRSNGQGPAHGTLVFGRYIDSTVITQWSTTAHLSLSVRRYDDPSLPPDFQNALGALSSAAPIFVQPLNDSLIAGYSRIDDLYGHPALVIRVDSPRVIYEQGQSTMHTLLLSLLLIGILFGGIILIGLDHSILVPLFRLSGALDRIGISNDLSARVEVNGKDELASLARTINGMLESLERSHTDITALQDAQAELQDKIASLQTLAKIEQIITAQTSLTDRLDRLLKETLKETRSDLATIYLLDSTQDAVAAFAQQGARDPDRWRALRFPVGESAAGWVVEHAQPLALTEANEDPRWKSIALSEDEKIISYLAVPMRVDGQVIGVLDVATRERRGFSPDAVKFLATLAGRTASAIENSRLFEAEQSRRAELSKLYELSRSLSDAAYDADAIMEIAAQHAVETVHVTAAQALVLEEGDLILRAFYPVRALEHTIEIGRRVPLAKNPYCQRVLEQNEPVCLSLDFSDLTAHERAALAIDAAQSICLVPLRVTDRPVGLLVLAEARNETREPFTPEKMRLARSIGDQTASALQRVQLYAELEHAYLLTVVSLAAAVDAKDSYTGDHSERLSQMAVAVGRALKLEARDLEELRFGAILHDIGKIGVPDAILLKPGALTGEEWIEMRKHPEVGAKIIEPIPRLAGAALIVRHHHERFDGKGYPDGLAAEAIPLGARILAVVDSYSAMTDKRVYKEARSFPDAAAELERCAGAQFDPHIVRVFLDLTETDRSPVLKFAAEEIPL